MSGHLPSVGAGKNVEPRPGAIDQEISALIAQWQAHAQEAVEVGLRMAQRLIELERERDQLRVELRNTREELRNMHGLARMASGELQQ